MKALCLVFNEDSLSPLHERLTLLASREADRERRREICAMASIARDLDTPQGSRIGEGELREFVDRALRLAGERGSHASERRYTGGPPGE